MSGIINFTAIWEIIDRVNAASEGEAWMYALSQKSTQDEILRLNFEDQLFEEGIDSKGFLLDNAYNHRTGPGEYSPYTIQEKMNRSGMGGRYDHITLYGMGNFYRSGRVEYDSDSFDILANADKGEDNLFDMFGTDILGLTKFNILRLQPMVYAYYGEFIAVKIFHIS